MTTLTLNRSPIQKDFSESQSLNEVVDHLFASEIGEESVLISLEVDGEDIPYDDSLNLNGKPIHDFKSVNFKTQTSLELAFEAIDSCNDYIDILTDKIKAMAQSYQKGESDEANALFGDMIDILDLYVQLFSRIHSTLKRNIKDPLDQSKEIQNLDIHLLSVLKALIPAKEKGDIIMLCDLLEYELIDNLTQWKIKIIPSLKKLRATSQEG
jgi:hypothetical protein